VLSSGAHSITARQSDVATNVSATSSALSVTIDTTAPSAPGTPDMTSGTDTGISSTDNITSDTTPTFDISCESGATVTLLNGSTSLGTGSCSGSTVSITSSALSEGSPSITARQADTAGNISATSSALSTTIDATAPVISSVTPTSSSSIDNVTTSSDVAYTLSESVNSATITITRTGGTADASSPRTCTLAGTAIASGAHTIDLSDTTNGCTVDESDLVSGTIYTFAFDATDTAGNTATQITRTSVTFDNVSSPTVTTSAASSVTDTTATLNGDITATGGENATERGFEHGLTTAYGATTSSSGSYGVAAFTESLTGLTCATTYHFRAYAENSDGIAYGSDTTFTTSACAEEEEEESSGGGRRSTFRRILGSITNTPTTVTEVVPDNVTVYQPVYYPINNVDNTSVDSGISLGNSGSGTSTRDETRRPIFGGMLGGEDTYPTSTSENILEKINTKQANIISTLKGLAIRVNTYIDSAIGMIVGLFGW
jgi:hypothetical protein